MLVDPPVEVYGQVFHAGAETHIGQAAEGQPDIGPERMGGDALGCQLFKAGIYFGGELEAVVVVVAGERGGLSILRRRVKGPVGQLGDIQLVPRHGPVDVVG